MGSRLLRPFGGLLLRLRSLMRVKTPSSLKVGGREFVIKVERWPANTHFLAQSRDAYSYRLTATTMISGSMNRVYFISKSMRLPGRAVDRMVRLGLFNRAKKSLNRRYHTD